MIKIGNYNSYLFPESCRRFSSTMAFKWSIVAIYPALLCITDCNASTGLSESWISYFNNKYRLLDFWKLILRNIRGNHFVSKQTVDHHFYHIYSRGIYLHLINLKSWLNLNMLDLFSISIDGFYNMFSDFRLSFDFTSRRALWWRCNHDIVGATSYINTGTSYTIQYNCQNNSNY